jgi:hypothetical protein
MKVVRRYTPANRVSALLLENVTQRGWLELDIQRGEVEKATIQTRFGGMDCLRDTSELEI